MKKMLLRFAFVSFFFNAEAADQVSALAPISETDRAEITAAFFELQKFPDYFVSCLSNQNNSWDFSNEELKGIIVSGLDKYATNEFKVKWKEIIDSGLGLGWQLARTDDFYWALPVLPSEYYRFVIRKKFCLDGAEEAEIFCVGKVPNLLSGFEKDSCRDSVGGCVKVKNPWNKKYQKIPWKCEYRAQFFLKKTVLGWKISDFKQRIFYPNFAER